MVARIELPYGGTTRLFTIPEEWLGEIALPRPVAPAGNIAGLIATALRHPIDSSPLAQLVRPGDAVAIIVDDFTRKTPTHLLLPPVLRELHSAGVGCDDIRIVVAPGTHRPMTPAELDAKLGAEVARDYRIVNIPGTSDAEMVYAGTPSPGIPAWVNRVVAAADVRIGLGMITPHLEAGFTGGAKIILPGVCGTRTVDAFHTASAFIPGNQLGNIDAPLRRTLEQFVAECVPLHFIVNVITTLDGKIFQCVAGDPIAAHRVGAQFARQVYGVPITRRYPIVVANCYPYDFDWWQSIKGVWAGDGMTQDNGTLVIVTAATEGNSNYPCVPQYTGSDPDSVRHEIRTGSVSDTMQAATGAMLGDLRRRIHPVLVSGGLTRADAAVMRMPYYESVEDAVVTAVKSLPESERKNSVGVLPQAGVTLPLPNLP